MPGKKPPTKDHLSALNAAASALAEDAESLAALHDRELSAELLAALHEADFPHCLALTPTSDEASAAWLATAASLPQDFGPQSLDELAAEYAAIYLTGAYAASPCESFWTDDDNLICQDAMFQLRKLYQTAGLSTPNWRQRAEDHLVLQLLFIKHSLQQASTLAHWRALANMLDEHLLRWMHKFAGRISQRSQSAFYAALAVLTAVWLDALRDTIAGQLGEARPSAEELETRLQREKVVEPVAAFMPGSGPSW